MAGSVLGLLAWLPGPALAHGRFPRLGQIVSHPTSPETVVVRGTFGLVISSDNGGQWRWICLPVMGVALNEDPTTAILHGGHIVAATFDGLVRSDPTGCNWSYPTPALTDVYVIDQAVHPTDFARAWIVTSDGLRENSVFRTIDSGASWEPTSPPIGAILFETIVVARTDPDRLYVSGAIPPTMTMPRQAFVFRSDDAGASWEQIAFPLGASDRNVYLLGVDPNDPDRILARVRGESEERLVESTDGGEAWSQRLTISDIAAFAWSENGATVYVGGVEGSGLQRSTDGARTFSQVGTWETSCVGFRGTETWLCGNDPIDGFALGRLTDEDSVEPLMRLSDVSELVSCEADDDTTLVCEPELLDLWSDLGSTPPDAVIPQPESPSNRASGVPR